MFNYVQVNLRLIDVESYPTPGSSPTPSATPERSTPAATPLEPSCSAPQTPRATTSVEVPSTPGVIQDWLRQSSLYDIPTFWSQDKGGPEGNRMEKKSNPSYQEF